MPAKKSVSPVPTVKVNAHTVAVRAALESIPEGPFWTTYGQLCLVMGRPTTNALAVAQMAAKVDGFTRWDQVRNGERKFSPMTMVAGKKVAGRFDPVTKLTHDAAQIAKWEKAHGLIVDAAGRADKSQQLTWSAKGWVLPDGTLAAPKPKRARKAAKAAPVVDAPVADAVVDAPVVEVPAEEVVAS